MTDEQRSRYFGHYWPAACEAKGWKVKDENQRRHTTGECMRLIGAPITESTTDLGQDEITALFCYLLFLANPSSLTHSQRWVDCQQDYHAFNRARQADWHERETYGRKPSRLDRDRFAGEASAQGEPQDVFDPEAIRQRHLTTANRHRRKLRKQKAGELRHVVAGQNSAGKIYASAANATPF